MTVYWLFGGHRPVEPLSVRVWRQVLTRAPQRLLLAEAKRVRRRERNSRWSA